MEQPRLETATGAVLALDVSIVMPCLDEAQCLPHCIANAWEALAEIAARFGIAGEIVIADNGSTDGSQELARSLGARVVAVAERGYGAALIGGCAAALGRYIVVGDADGSYDFKDGVAMVGRLVEGADVCMGSRFAGGIAPGAMPWKNRWIGNPLLTGILNLFFGAGIDDAHCGLRAMTRACFLDLGLSGTGMEFASEMVIKAALKRKRIDQVPATLARDLRQRPPHLRPWRDGWRHLRYLLMLSPTWLFGLPAAAAMGGASLILLVAFLHLVGILPGISRFGMSWTIVAGFLFTSGQLAAIMALATHLHGVKQGYRFLRPSIARHADLLKLETLLAAGFGLIGLSLAGMAAIGFYWSESGFAALPNTLPLVLAAVVGASGLQTVFGGFLLAIIVGHVADFVREVGYRDPAAVSALRRNEPIGDARLPGRQTAQHA